MLLLPARHDARARMLMLLCALPCYAIQMFDAPVFRRAMPNS